MKTQNTRKILSNLYGLMMEISYHREDEDVAQELQENPDPQIERHLIRIKQITAKLKAEANKQRFAEAKEQLKQLKEKGLEGLKRLITPEERIQLAPFFRKFEELSKEDEEAILEDQELLKLLEILKKKIDDSK